MSTQFIPLTPASLSAALTDSAEYASVYFDAFWSVGLWILAISVAVIVCGLIIKGIAGIGYSVMDSVDNYFAKKQKYD